ncbi:MAG TPA: sialidase family protein [Anaerolineales bacterium]|nr:sialidase family protein [Anaerolineales bacterium]
MKKNIYLTVFLTFLFILLFPGAGARAQTISGDDWSTPVNLSHSGSATDPGITFDAEGKYQLLWNDEFVGPVYVSGNETGWDTPSAVTLPLDDSIPTLIADQNGNIHTFWVGSDAGLYYSRARAAEFAQTATEASVVKLSDSALDFDVTLDSSGDIHLSYIQPLDAPELPAGVYYRFLSNGSTGWSSPAGIYFSPYFRALEPADSNVDIATSTSDESVNVYIAWDNRPRERVYLAKSTDEGRTWNDPQEIDRSDLELGSGNPLNLQVTALEDTVLLVWQRLNLAGSCPFQYRWSGDTGITWSETKQMLEPPPLCGQDNRILSNGSDFALFWTILQSQVNLVAWDWDQKLWSDPQIQNELSTFNDQETSGQVSFGCLQPQLVQNNQLAVVGCDTGDGKDIWFTSRRLSNIADWFPTEAGWSKPFELVTKPLEMKAPVLVSGPGKLLHVLWSQASGDRSDSNRTSIFYIGGDGEVWTQPVEVIQLPDESAGQPAAAIDAQGRLLVAWSSIKDGKIFFSWANSARANSIAEWSDQIPISQPESVARTPFILVSDNGTIYVIYSVPLNEGRGIYLARSEDGGENWAQPVRIFDGVSAGWQMVDQPQITQTPDGDLHALWVHKPLPGESGTLGLYYARSGDGGNTWSEAEQVAGTNVIWSQITSADKGSVYRNWQEEINGEPVIRYQHLLEGGTDWSAPQSLSSFGESLQNAKLVLDPSERLHLLQIVQGSTGRFILRHWIWEDERWSVNENVELGYEPTSQISAMGVTASPNGKLDLIYSTIKGTELSGVLQYAISYLDRPLELPVDLPALQANTPAPTALPSPPAQPTFEPASTIQPTPTPDLSGLSLAGPSGSGGSSTTGVVIGVVLSGLIVAAVLAFRVLKPRFTS